MARIFLVFLFFLPALVSSAQVEKQVKTPPGDLPAQKQSRPQDTRLAAQKLKADSIKSKAREDSIALRKRSDIQTTITYSARDSLNSTIDKKIVHLYGDAKIKYGEIQLMAEEITIDYENSTLSATGIIDSAGRHVGFPIFINGPEKYETKSIVYNFKTKKARISEIVTKQGDGFLHGNAVFKNQKNELLTLRNAYTTCDLAHPHYQIIASKAKAIPDDKVIVGPFFMEINEVPLPLGFGFGMFPAPRKSASGIIVPVYGEERNRGFFLRNGGYFFDISDYFKLRLTGDIYSKGSSALYINSDYRVRYRYSGSFNFSFTNNKVSPNIEDPTTTKDFRITWSHSPQTKGTGRFSASVNAATATYNNNNFLPLSTNPAVPRLDNSSRKLSSNISYSKSFGTLFSLGINFRINQDLTTKQVDLPFPDLSFNVNNIYPFKKKAKGMLLQNLSTRYTMTATNQITNNLGRIKKGGDITQDSIAPFNFQNMPTFIQNARKGVRHTIPVSTSFKVLKFFTVSPSVSIDEIWYFNKLHWGTSADGRTAVVKDTVQGFNRVNNYTTSLSLTTRIYGTYFFSKGKSGIQAIRHIINPTAGLSFSPDFGDPKYGYYEQLRLKDNPNIVYKSVHEGFAYGSSRLGRSASLGFGLNNNIEMKVRGKKDTVAKKVALFNTLSIGSSYNFVADSFKLAPFNMAANTNVLNDKLNVSITGILDPYNYITVKQKEGTRTVEIKTSQVAWTPYQINSTNYEYVSGGGGIGRITSANLALSTNFNPKGQKKDTDIRDRIGKAQASDTDKAFLLKNPDSYIDFKIPWNLRLSYNVDYSHPVNTKSKLTQAMRFNGDFSLSEKWKIVFNSGYDFQAKDLTQTYITIARDLHCWQINVNWVPFGKYQSYSFAISVKSALLKDLKLNRQRSFFDN